MGAQKLKMADGTIVQVKQQDMNKEMLDFAMATAQIAIEKITQKEEEAAEEIKAAMDKKYMPSWQCIVGRSTHYSLTTRSVFTHYSLSVHSLFTQYSLTIGSLFTQYCDRGFK